MCVCIYIYTYVYIYINKGMRGIFNGTMDIMGISWKWEYHNHDREFPIVYYHDMG